MGLGVALGCILAVSVVVYIRCGRSSKIEGEVTSSSGTEPVERITHAANPTYLSEQAMINSEQTFQVLD
jgi:hypothetical protein